MSSVWHVARKEVGTFFSSLAALIFIAVFLGVCLFVFFWVETFFARNIADVRPLFEWMPVLLIFLVAALTMRLWSEERRSGTLEFLLTAPVRPVDLVLGKFAACMALVAIALALTLPLPVTVSLLGPVDWGPVIGGYVATLCLAAAYVAIGLFVSARTDNQIVSLIVTALICGAFYLVGSDALTRLLGNWGGEALKLLGSGSRFESITRGVIDLRDLYYYLSIFGVFLVLNVYALERLRWSAEGRDKKHLAWRVGAGLLVANLLAANTWLQQVGWARTDLTDGNIYSVSDTTRSYLRQLQEPLLIRGYFSAQTHPLLAPLVPRLRDLLKEYEVAGGGKVRVEFVDPVEEPELEEEASRRYGIQPVPFQTTSKYQAAVTNSYFDVLVQYGDEHETLGFRDLIEVKAQNEASIDVELRNPEYDITRAIKKVLSAYRGGGDLFASIPNTVTLEAYVSPEDTLPDPLPQLKRELEAVIGELEADAGGKLAARIQDPEASGGALAEDLQRRYGFQPLTVGLLDRKSFWFHLVLRSDDRAVQVALPATLDKDALKRSIEDGLKRFTPGALRAIALHTPAPPPAMGQFAMPQSGPRFRLLEDKLGETSIVEPANLAEGRVPDRADLLFVAAPENLNDTQLFAIDQFLMKGGTVVLATSPFMPSLTRQLAVRKSESGLADWLAHHGLSLEEVMVLDPQNAALPVPVEREAGGFRVREVHMLDYPYFVDIRRDGMADGSAPTAGLSQLTMSWASPIALDQDALKGRTVVPLVQSSPDSWTSDSTEIVPDFRAFTDHGFAVGKDRGRQLLGVAVEGKFTSYFAGKPSPLAQAAGEAEGDDTSGARTNPGDATEDKAEEKKAPVISGVIDRSPESARLILLGSTSFLSDSVLDIVSGAGGSQYLTPVTLAENLVDWSLEDRGLLALRSRSGHFARTLLPLGRDMQLVWEYGNYILAFLGLAGVLGLRRYVQRLAARRHRAMLQIQGA
ncbi:MAG: Gldg family protein [Alphaproteobacteria bacterium]|nr:Gldg family protein [Alphaproteobacteria bacterium]